MLGSVKVWCSSHFSSLCFGYCKFSFWKGIDVALSFVCLIFCTLFFSSFFLNFFQYLKLCQLVSVLVLYYTCEAKSNSTDFLFSTLIRK